jgi:hypothetical protein
MKKASTVVGNNSVIGSFCAFVICGTLMLSVAQAQYVDPVYLTSGNSVAGVDVGSSAGMFSWAVDGQNQLKQQWFWWRVGLTGPEYAVDQGTTYAKLQSAPNLLTVTYSDLLGRFDVRIDYKMFGGAPGDGQSDITETIAIYNKTASPLNFHFFQYSDFNIDGIGNNDTVQILSDDSGYYSAIQLDGTYYGVSETIGSPSANRAQAALAGVAGETLALLTDAFTTDLNNDDFEGPGDVTWALQWNFDIAANGSIEVFKDKQLKVGYIPEPGAMSLLGFGAVALLLRRRSR